MEDGEDKVESSTEVSSDAAAQCDRISDLNSQIDKLKSELEVVKKKLRKAEYERDSAQRNAENLKGEVRELSKKLQQERKKTAESRRKNSDAQQTNKKIQDAAVSSLIQEKDSRQSDAAGSKDLQASLQEAAADAMSQSGFVYDDRTGLYYDWNTGYYYDPNSHLYYENTTGTYYYYDEPSATYKFHSKIDISNNQEVTVNKDDEVDKEEKESCKEYSEDDEENDLEVIEVQYPCIRAIVIKASKLKVGSLFIVTYTGGTIGREKDMSHVIRIPDVEVSKLQCKIEFDKERRQFFICDVGSRNGTFLNGLRLSESKQKSEQRVITHGDELTLGTTTLCLHIHPGTQTCDSCEPGQVQAQAPQGTSFLQDDEVCITKVVEGDRSLNSLSVQEQRKSELKRIKKAYALEESSYSEQTIDATHAGKYKDRADIRRSKVGSDVPVVIADDPPASVHRPISTGNVGRQMLEKMGWKEGEGLGPEGDGRREPVIVEVRDNLRGLGAGVKRSIDDVERKSYIRSKTRERFGQAAPVISGPQRFVAADGTKTAKKSSPTLKINNETKPTVQPELTLVQPNDIQVTSQTNETKEVDIFAE